MAQRVQEIREIGGEQFRVCYLDPDNRPLTAGKEHVCSMCSREIKNVSAAKMVHLVSGGPWALHCGDEERYQKLNAAQPGGQFPDEMGGHLIGPDCARRLPEGFAHD